MRKPPRTKADAADLLPANLRRPDVAARTALFAPEWESVAPYPAWMHWIAELSLAANLPWAKAWELANSIYTLPQWAAETGR